MDKFIPLSIPNFEENEEKYVVDAIASTYVSTVSGYVSRMEGELASFLNVEDVAVCQSGISALHLSLVDKPIALMITQFEGQMQLECAAFVSLIILVVNVAMKYVVFMGKKAMTR